MRSGTARAAATLPERGAARTERAGLKEGAIPVGADVTIVGKRNRDANRFEIKTERVTYDGRHYDVYPERL